MRRRTKRKAVLIVLISIAAFLVIFFLFSLFSHESKTYNAPIEYMEYNGEMYLENTSLEHFLIIGTDSHEILQEESYFTPARADFLLLISLDPIDKEYTILHINRDTIADVARYDISGGYLETSRKQIALAYTHGNSPQRSALNTVNSVSALLGIDIDYYFTMDMDAVGIINDRMGGVNLVLDRDYTDIDPSYTSGSEIKLKGDKALEFVRARMGVGESTNVERMARQKLYIEAFLSQMTENNDLDEDFLLRVYNSAGEHITTNCNIKNTTRVLSSVSEYECRAVLTPEGDSVEGEKYMEFHPDEESLKKLIAENYYEKHDND